jgi:hypothetical protein
MAQNTNIDINVNVKDEQVEQSEGKFVSLRRQIRETMVQLQALTDAGDTQGKKFTELNLKLAELKTEQEQVNNKTQSLTATFGLLGGEVGEFGDKAEVGIQALKTLSSFTLQDIKNQFLVVGQELKTFVLKIADAAGITKVYEALNVGLAKSFQAVGIAEEEATVAAEGFSTAIVATGIGALIIGLIALVQNWNEVERAISGVNEEEELLEENQSKVTKSVQDFQEKLIGVKNSIELAKEGVISKKEALKEYNEKLGSTVGYAKNLNEAEDLLNKNTTHVIENIKLKAQATIFYGKAAEASAKLVSGEGLKPGFWESTYLLIKSGGNAIEALTDRSKEFYKENADQAEAFTKAGDELTRKQIENDKKLAGSRVKPETEKTKLDPRIAQAKAVQAELDKIAEDAYSKTLDDRDRELYVEGEKYNTLLTKAKKYGLDTTALTEAYKTQLATINKKYDDKETAEQDKRRKEIEQFEVKLAQDLQKLDDKKKADKIKAYEDDIKLLSAQQAGLEKNSKAYFDIIIKIEDEAYKTKKLKAEGNAKELETIEVEHQNNSINIEKQKNDAKLALNNQYLDEVIKIGNGLQQLAGKDKDLAIAGIRITEAATISKIIMNDLAATRKAYEASPTTFGLPWSAFYIADAIIGTAAAVSTANNAISALESGGGASGGGASVTPDRNSTAGLQGYAEGGMISGPSHLQGGVNINAQGGEAVMTRGAVSMFGPMLSMMNQAGGGTAFNKAVYGMARQDNPKTPGNPNHEPQIIKTYVVANELNSIQHRQARLKDLSTL